MGIEAEFRAFYKGKKVLVTGHTGFKGSWLSIWLHELGAQVIGFSLDPYTTKDNFVLSGLSDKITDIRGDIRDKEHLRSVFNEYKPEIVFHLAAQPLVKASYEIPVETYEVNVLGSINVMECIRFSDTCSTGVMITTDKCYENREQIWGYRENDAMGGYDPYSSSKGAAEIAINSWRRSFFNPDNYSEHGKLIASARAGNVIGGGDWSTNRILPDCIKALEQDLAIEIRSPGAVRPWQHVLEPLRGYLMLAKKMIENPIRYCDGWNFGPENDSIVPVWKIAELVVSNYGKGELVDVSNKKDVHEANLLSLDITKARTLLNWVPVLNIEKTIALTVDWYKRYKSESAFDICIDHISRYVNDL